MPTGVKEGSVAWYRQELSQLGIKHSDLKVKAALKAAYDSAQAQDTEEEAAPAAEEAAPAAEEAAPAAEEAAPAAEEAAPAAEHLVVYCGVALSSVLCDGLSRCVRRFR